MKTFLFIIKRLAQAGATLIVLSFIIFSLFFFVPEESGYYLRESQTISSESLTAESLASESLASESLTPELLESIYATYYWEPSFFEQYLLFVGSIFHFDFGTSIVTGYSVPEYVIPFAALTLSLVGLATLLYIIFGLAFGTVASKYKKRNEMGADYAVLFMKARSLSTFQITLAGLKNAFPDTFRNISILLPSLFGGVALIEIIFSLPGLSYLLVSSSILGDVPVIRFILLIVVAFLCLAMALFDILVYLFLPKLNDSGSTCASSPHYTKGSILFLFLLTILLFIGTRGAMIAPLCIAFVSLIIGLILGHVAAWFGGWTSRVISAYTYVFISIPTILFAIAITGVLDAEYWLRVVALILLFFPSDIRLVRSVVAKQMQMPYITSAFRMKITSSRIILKHIFPNIYITLLVRFFRNVVFASILMTLLSTVFCA